MRRSAGFAGIFHSRSCVPGVVCVDRRSAWNVFPRNRGETLQTQRDRRRHVSRLGEANRSCKHRRPNFPACGRDDELVAPPQLLAVERLIGTSPRDIRKLTADCCHLGLFMSKNVLRELWPTIVKWLIKTPTPVPKRQRTAGVARAA